MANTKGKIIIGGAIALVGGFVAWRIVRNVKQNKIKKSILQQINDPKNIGATVSANETHKFTKGMDSSFWKKTKGSPLPTGLIPDRKARDYAREIYGNMGYIWNSESGIMSSVKKAKTQGAMSQIAFQYEQLGYGNLADALESTLEESWFEDGKLKQLNTYINSLPY